MLQTFAQAVLANFKDLLLSFVEQNTNICFFGLVAQADNLSPGPDQFAQDRIALDNAGVIFNIGGGRNAVDQRKQIRGPTRSVERILAFERIGQTENIHGLAFGKQEANLFVDQIVGGNIK